MPRLRLRAAVVLSALAAAGAFPAPAAPLPEWSLTGIYDLPFDAGFQSVAADYEVAFEGASGTLSVGYTEKGALSVGGFLEAPDGATFVRLSGAFSVGTDGKQTVTIAEPVKRPRFRFEGVVDDVRGDIVGSYTRSDGFAALTGPAEGPLTLAKTPPAAGSSTWRLRARTTMDRKGVVRNGLAQDGTSQDFARLTLFDGRELLGGRIKGRVRTKVVDSTTSTTTATMKIRGKGWRADFTGPVDADGFHATGRVSGGGFVAEGARLTFPVVEGPEPPPPPPPPPPKNLLTRGSASIVAGQVTLFRANVPRKFKPLAGGDLTVQFPTSDANLTVVADPMSASGPSPRRCFVDFGRKTFGTATSPASVTLEILEFSTIPGQQIEVLCTGTVVEPSGRKRTVDVLLQCTVE